MGFRDRYSHHPAQKHARVGTFPLRVGIGKMSTDIAQCHSAEKRVAEGMESHIGITVPEQPLFIGNIDATHYAAASFDETVHVESIANTKIR